MVLIYSVYANHGIRLHRHSNWSLHRQSLKAFIHRIATWIASASPPEQPHVPQFVRVKPAQTNSLVPASALARKPRLTADCSTRNLTGDTTKSRNRRGYSSMIVRARYMEATKLDVPITERYNAFVLVTWSAIAWTLVCDDHWPLR